MEIITNFLFLNRTNLPWSGLDNYLEQFNYEIISAEKDGHCFTTSIWQCMAWDHGMQFSNFDIKKLLMSEVSVNRGKYKHFYSKSIDTMLTSLEKYLTFGVYSQEVVDIAILATAKVLSVNMCIYKEQNGKTLLITQTSDPPSSCDVYLKYECEHYDAICSMRPDQNKTVKDNISTSVDNLVPNDIPLECGFTQNQINVYALEGTFFEAYRENGEKYLVMPTNVPTTHPMIQSIISSNSKTERQSHQLHINTFFKPTTPTKYTNFKNEKDITQLCEKRNKLCNVLGANYSPKNTNDNG